MNGTTVFFDLETGGLELHHPIIQIAAIAVGPGWKELETVEVKLHFVPDLCTREALEVNSYDPAVWASEAVGEAEAKRQLDPFFERHKTWDLVSRAGNAYKATRIAGHNAKEFDAPRLRQWWGGYTPFSWWYCFDTVQLALWWFATKGEKQPRNYQLVTLCEHFGIEHADAHDALGDVRATIALAKRLS